MKKILFKSLLIQIGLIFGMIVIIEGAAGRSVSIVLKKLFHFSIQKNNNFNIMKIHKIFH